VGEVGERRGGLFKTSPRHPDIAWRKLIGEEVCDGDADVLTGLFL